MRSATMARGFSRSKTKAGRPNAIASRTKHVASELLPQPGVAGKADDCAFRQLRFTDETASGSADAHTGGRSLNSW